MPISKKRTSSKRVIEDAKKIQPVTKTTSEFKNITKRNVFTSKGRVATGCTITIPVSEGKANMGLEECPN